MRVLWAVNTLSPAAAKEFDVKSQHAISWVEAMSRQIRSAPDFKLAIAAPGNCSAMRKQEIDGVLYYLVPESGIRAAWAAVLDDFRPDLIHVYGTEARPNYELVTGYSQQYPIVISLQGLLSEYWKHYYAGLTTWEILKFTTPADVVFGYGVFQGKKRFRANAAQEAEMLRAVRYVEGRSGWDRSVSWQVNHDLRYFHCPRMIRAPFYDAKWDREHFEPHTVFVHQGNYPIKGLHFLLEAVRTLKPDYPQIKVYISGKDFTRKTSLKARLTSSGYHNYIAGLIRKYGLEDNIVFTGYLDAEKLAGMLERVNVCINTSAIENMPNSVAEAMLVGVPCIASYVGGTPEMLNYGQCGLLYDYDDTAMLAAAIRDVFEDPEAAAERAGLAREVSRQRHDPRTLVQTLLGIYGQILSAEQG